MSIIGQPASYGDILKRIFYSTLVVGIICTIATASTSDALYEAFNETDKFLSNLTTLEKKYVVSLLPFLIAIISRVIYLHNKLQKPLYLRKTFETKHIIQPLAHRCGREIEKDQLNNDKKLKELMRKAFYKYASFTDPIIDKQLVYSAADRWGWFWSALEANFLFIVTSILFAILGSWGWFFITLVPILALTFFMTYQWGQLIESAHDQVDAIADDSARIHHIRNCIDSTFPTSNKNSSRRI